MIHFAAHRACPQAHRLQAETACASKTCTHINSYSSDPAHVHSLSIRSPCVFCVGSLINVREVGTIKCAGALQLSTDLGLAMWRACSSRQSPATPRRLCERASAGSCPMGAMLAACATAMGAQGTSPSPESARKCADMRVSQCSASSGSDGSCPAQPAQRMAS